MRRHDHRDERLHDVQDHHRQPVTPAVRPPDVGRADVLAADCADVDALREADDPEPERDAPAQVADDDEERDRQRASRLLRGCHGYARIP
jgi:hypothetical protein